MIFNRVTKSQGLAQVTELVERFRPQASELTRPGAQFTETDARVSFIDPLLEALGWDVRNISGLPQRLAEVVMERTATDTEGSWGRPDYRLRIDGTDTIPVEAKKPSVAIAETPAAALQARSYGWSLSLPASILTNFNELIIFDTRTAPLADDNADVAIIPGGHFGFEEFVTRFDELWNLASFESLQNKGLEGVYGYKRPPRGDSPFDQRFLAEFRKWRRLLAQTIADENTSLEAAEIGRRTQKLLNALLFLRVCEDRNIGEYKNLLESATNRRIVNAFKEADRAFNAGLFTVLRETSVSDQALISVVKEMYWPRTQFAFGILEPEILSGVYEQYLAEIVVLDSARRVMLELKPEVSHAGGVVATPDHIVREICKSTIGPLLEKGIPPKLSVLDPAVGSGIFLLDVFKRLLDASMSSLTPMPLADRGELAKQHLFGVDIDSAAVEVTKLSILLAVLGNENVDLSTAQDLLPDLSRNIVTGNTVVREDFDALLPSIARHPYRRAQVNPLDLKKSIGSELYPQHGFDVIVGNPPYVRIQVMAEHMPDQLEYLQSPKSRYESAKTNNFDLYLIFIERALELLSPTGRLGMIVPHRFTNQLSASGIRRKLGQRLERMVHFGEEQVFPRRTTYTAIVIVGQKREEPLTVEMVRDLGSWWETGISERLQIKRDVLGAGVWPFATADQSKLFEELRAGAIAALGDQDWVHIFVGVQTSADNWYFLDPTPSESPAIAEFVDCTGVNTRIERSLLRSAVKDQQIDFFDGQPVSDRHVIFPYNIDTKTGRASVISTKEMRLKYPLAHTYFERHRNKLEFDRNVLPHPGDAFWAYGRAQSLGKLSGPKLIARVMSLIPRYALDRENFVAPGGGDGGPYVFLRPQENCLYSINVIQAIVSHPAVDLFVSVTGKKFRGSYAVHRKAFLEKIPVPELSEQEQTFIDSRVHEIQNLSVALRTENDSDICRSMKSRRSFLTAEVSNTITRAYGLSPDLLDRVIGQG